MVIMQVASNNIKKKFNVGKCLLVGTNRMDGVFVHEPLLEYIPKSVAIQFHALEESALSS